MWVRGGGVPRPIPSLRGAAIRNGRGRAVRCSHLALCGIASGCGVPRSSGLFAPCAARPTLRRAAASIPHAEHRLRPLRGRGGMGHSSNGCDPSGVRLMADVGNAPRKTWSIRARVFDPGGVTAICICPPRRHSTLKGSQGGAGPGPTPSSPRRITGSGLSGTIPQADTRFDTGDGRYGWPGTTSKQRSPKGIFKLSRTESINLIQVVGPFLVRTTNRSSVALAIVALVTDGWK